MASISIFDIFKIGIGPFSSHTFGPWKAALVFAKNLSHHEKIDTVEIHLYGSLSKTGIGHATDKAVILGLMGYYPETIDIDLVDTTIDQVYASKTITSKYTPVYSLSRWCHCGRADFCFRRRRIYRI